MDPVRILETLVFLGLIIFVHELGHFWAARWAGVLVERFSIGFGPVILAFKRGETEYAISAIPLGGYVKMLGQSDTPTVEQPSDDRRSYQNKTVFQRMVIISAGVVMNIIFGMICFAVAFSLGVPYAPALVGAAIPGRPAWKAGLEPGDRIAEINGHKNPDYEMVVNQVIFTNPKTQSVAITVDRKGEKIDFEIHPELLKGDDRPMIGYAQGLSLSVVTEEIKLADPTFPFTPAARAQAFKVGDVVVACNGKAVSSYSDFDRICFDNRTEPIVVTVERGSEKSRVDIKVEPAFVRTIGARMRMGAITAVRPSSPASKAVDPQGQPKPIEPGDNIIAVDGVEDFDPMKLADMIAAKAGQKVELTLRRAGRTQEEFKATVIPEDKPTWSDFSHPPGFHPGMDASIPSLGIAYRVTNVVHAVDSIGEAAGLKPNDVVKKMEFTVLISQPLADELEKDWWRKWITRKPIKTTAEGPIDEGKIELAGDTWAGIFWGLQDPAIRKIILTIERPVEGKDPQVIQVEVPMKDDPSWALHWRGINFMPERGIKVGSNVFESVGMGFEYTQQTLIRVYMTLRALVMRNISPNLLSGPIRLANTAYRATEDFRFLILLVGLININLAVVNFLPIPVLDGGHMVFLLYEAITRRRPNEKFVLISHMIGLACILSLMIFVIYLDITNLFWK